MSLTPELLYAYLDGSLTGAERKRVRTLLCSDRQALERLGRQVLLSDAARESFAKDLEVPVPDAWVAMINAAAAEPARATAESATGWNPLAWAFSSRWALGAAMAASVVCGVLIGGMGTPNGLIQVTNGQLVASEDLAAALDTAKGGVAVAMNPEYQLDVQLSLRTRLGEYCREAIIDAADPEPDRYILACKEGESWQVSAVAQAAPRESGFAPVSSDSPLDSLVSALDAEVLDGSGEEQAIRKGWRQQSKP